MAQSAHLMTLGLCRISSAKVSPRSAAHPAAHPPPDKCPRSTQPGGRKWSHISDHRSTASRKQRLLCFLCPLVLPSRRLLDIHVRSHQAAGGFGCVRCSWKADTWEEMEPHWRSHCRRKGHTEEKKKKRRRIGRKQQERKAADSKARGSKVHQLTSGSYTQRRRDNHSGH